MKELEEGLREPEGLRAPQENLQSKVTWAEAGLTEAEPPTKYGAWTGPRPPTHL